MTKAKWVVALSILTASLAVMAQGVPGLINYQGRLFDGTGQPVNEAALAMEFSLWDKEVTLEQVTDEVAVMNGATAVSLGHLDISGGSELVTAVGGVPTYESPRDYVMDYVNGTITRVPTGFILDGQSVEVDYDWTDYGSEIWSETQAVDVVNGLYHVQLGEYSSLDASLLDSSSIYLEVEANLEVLSPRQRLTSVPFAMKADEAVTLDGYSLSAFSLVGHTHDFTEITGQATDAQVPDDITIVFAQDSGQLGGQAPDAYVASSGDTITGALDVGGRVNLGQDLIVQGDVAVLGNNIGIGRMPDDQFSIMNDYASPPDYGADLAGNYLGVLGGWAGDYNNYGTLGEEYWGVFGNAGSSAATSQRTGGAFQGTSQGYAYGVSGFAYGYGSDPAVGVHTQAVNYDSGSVYAAMFESLPNGTGTHYGVYANADDYSGWFAGGVVHVGSYGSEDYVDGEGDVYVEDLLEVDNDVYVADDAFIGDYLSAGGDAYIGGGNIGLGTAPSSTYGVLNVSAGAPSYGAYLYGSDSGVYGAYAGDPADHYGYLGSVQYGVYGRSGNSDETANRYGGRFLSYSQSSSYGAFAAGYGYGSYEAQGVNGFGYNSSTGNAYGGYFSTSSAGTGTHYGVFSAVYDDYAGWFQGGLVHVGSSGTEDYVGGDGDLYVEDALEVDNDVYVTDDAYIGDYLSTGGDAYIGGGNIGLGVAPDSSCGIINGDSTAAYYGAMLSGTGVGVYGALAGDPGDHLGYLGSATYGVYGRSGASDETSTRYGGYFLGYSQGIAYGVFGIAHGYGPSTAYGVRANSFNEGDGDVYGGYFYTGSNGDGDKYGVFGSASGNSSGETAYGVRGYAYNSVGESYGVYGYGYSGDDYAYGGYFSTGTSAAGINYGVYAESAETPLYAALSTDAYDHYVTLATSYYGIYAVSGASDETFTRYGGRYYSYSQGISYGVNASAFGYGASSVYGLRGTADADASGATGSAYGAYLSAYSNSTAYGLYVSAGTKNWVNPDPEDPDQSIVYATLEGGENGTYWRGTARLENGVAEVILPDHFRKATSPDYPVTVTLGALGDCNGIMVAEKSNERIVVKEFRGGTSNVEFDFMVMGKRLGYEEYQPIIKNVDYVPFQGNNADMDESETTTQEFYDKHSEGVKQIFKKNGILDQEGKVNEKLFEEKGWKNNKEKKPKQEKF